MLDPACLRFILAIFFLNLGAACSALAAPTNLFAYNGADKPVLLNWVAGTRLELSVAYSGGGKLSYRWYRDGRLLPGFKTQKLMIGSLTWAQRGAYTVEITDLADGVTTRRLFFVNVSLPRVQLVGFGDNTQGQSSVPASLLPPAPIQAIAAGRAHSLAISSGNLFAWGDNVAGQCTPPTSLPSRIYAVAAGADHSLALAESGVVHAWGDNSSGQCNVPPTLGVARAIAAGGGHSLAIKIDGTVVGWGDNASGQLDAPTFSSAVVAIAAGHDHSLALLENGAVVAWGANDRGQCSVPAGLRNIISIGAAGDASFAVPKTGRVVSWGDTTFGQAPAPTKQKPAASGAGGWDFIAAQLSTGGLAFWGEGADGLAADSQGVGQIYALAAGGGHLLALRDGAKDVTPKIIVQLLSTMNTTWDKPVTLSVQAKGTLLTYQWYFNSEPIPGATEATYRIDAMRLETVGTYYVRVFSGAGNISSSSIYLPRPDMPPLVMAPAMPRRQVVAVGDRLRIEASGRGAGNVTYQWFHNHEKLIGQNSPVLDLPINDESDGGTYIALATDEGRQSAYSPSFVVVPPVKPTRIVAWGDNSLGQTLVPEGLHDVIKLAAGAAHTLALRADGTVVAWGDNRRRQCQVPENLSEVVDIAASEFYSAALKTDGTIIAWGGGRDPISQTTPDLQAHAIQVYSRGVHAYSEPARQHVLSELPDFGGLFDYALTAGGWVSASQVWDPADLPLPEPASNTYAKTAKSVGINGAGYLVELWNVLPLPVGSLAPPQPYEKSLIYSSYGVGVRAFSHYHGASATILADQRAAFWRTGQYSRLEYDQYGGSHRVYYWASYPIKGEQRINDAKAVLAGGNFFAWQCGEGGIGGFGDLVHFHGAPYRLDGMKLWCAGRDHTAALIAMDAPPAPEVLELTPGRAAGPGESVRLRVRATGAHLRYQWLFNDQPIAGADMPDLLMVGFDSSKAGAYRVQISNGFTTITSEACDLRLGIAPTLVQAPARRLGLRVGARLELRATLEDDTGCRFEWRRNGALLENEHLPTLVREAATLADAGRYTLRVTGPDGTTAVATSHVFVLPASGTRIIHEWDIQDPLGTPKPWQSIEDAVDFLPSGMALRLDGRVAVWNGNAPYSTESPIPAWAAELRDIVAIADWGALRSDGTLAIRPYATSEIPAEALQLNTVIAVTSNPPAAVLEDGRVALFEKSSSSSATLRWLPGVGELAQVRSARLRLTPAQTPIYSTPLTDAIVLAAGEDGTISSSADNGRMALPPLTSARAILEDRDGGVSIIDAGGKVHASSLFGRLHAANAAMANIIQTDAATNVRAELDQTGKVRVWSTTWSQTGYSAVERPALSVWKRDNLRVRLTGESEVMVLRSADSLPTVSFATARHIFSAEQPVVLEAQVSGMGDFDVVWERNGAVLRDAKSARLELPAADPRNQGWYRVRVTDADGNIREAVTYVLIHAPGAVVESVSSYYKAPPPLGDVVEIGDRIAVRADGSVVMWDDYYGANYGVIPESVRDVVTVTTQGTALDASGRLTQWQPVSGQIIRQVEGVLWIQPSDRLTGFAIMRDGTVRSLEDWTLLYANPNQPWYREVVNVRYGQVGRNFVSAITKRNGSVAIVPDYLYTGGSITLLSPGQLGGDVIDSRVTINKGAQFLIETDSGLLNLVNANGVAEATTLVALDRVSQSFLGIDQNRNLVGANGSISRGGVLRLCSPWVLAKPRAEIAP